MENIEAMLCAYVEGDLDATGRAQIEKHLADHPQHRKLLDELMAMRELVRGLPHARAPMDVGDSLRQKVERSMLLGDSASSSPQRHRVDRWPQFFGIAAIFLLFASLCFIVYKALGPTLKPAVFTQNVADNLPETQQADRQTMLQPAPESAKDVAGAGAALPQTAAPQPAANIAASESILKNAQNLVVQSQQQLAAVAQVNFQAIRRRLENSGYGIDSAAPKSASVLVVVDSTDPSATKAQITQFLSNHSEISWKTVPSESENGSSATTLPSPSSIAGPIRAAQAGKVAQPLLDVNDAATQPSGELYVARGLTPERVDALRKSLTVPLNGPEVQVTVQSAQSLATTQPSVVSFGNAGPAGLGALPASATTRPAEGANSPADLALAPSTAPSAPGFGGSEVITANNFPALPTVENKSQILLPVDGVIVLQPARVAVNPAAATTQPALLQAQPSETTENPAVPSTQP